MCKCECGNIVSVSGRNLTHNRGLISCGCIKPIEHNEKDIYVRTNVINNKFKNTKYIFGYFDGYEGKERKQIVIFYDTLGYYYKIIYRTLLNIDFNNLDIIKNRITLTNSFNPFSLDNIKLWIKNNNCNFDYISGEYINNKAKTIKCLCHKCGEVFETSWASIITYRGCNKCCCNIKRTNDEFIKEVYDLVGDEYVFMEEYSGTINKILCRHNICGYTYYIEPVRFLKTGQRCPSCNVSKGEAKIRDFLIYNNIYFEREKAYDDLVGFSGLNLRFDFIINHKDIEFLCEYQGRMHYEFVDGIHETIEDFKKQQIYDDMKRRYAKTNNIDLVEIPYWDYENIENILKDKLKL